MKVVFIHTDFRIYWPARLRALSCFLESKQISLSVVEIAGAGSPYAFAQEIMKIRIGIFYSQIERWKNWEIEK